MSAQITRNDLEAAFSRVVGAGEKSAEEAMPKAMMLAGIVALAFVTAVYLVGKRSGRRKASVVEIRRL